MGKTSYEKLQEEIKANTKSRAFSRSALQSMANGYMNDLEHVTKKFVPNGDTFEVQETKPAKEFRDGMKTVIKKTFGVDAAELDKLDDAQLPKSVTNAMMDCAQAIEHDYMDTGKSLQYPTYAADEARMSIRMKDVDEKVASTKKIEKQEDGTYASVPTGNTYRYAKHKEAASSNKLPSYLKKKIN